MVRKQAIKRLIWQFLLIIISALIFKSLWASIIVLYFVRTLFFAGMVKSEPTPFQGKEEYVSVKSAIITDSIMALVMIGLPLIPSMILVKVFPDYKWVSSVIAIVTLLHLIAKPIFYDLIRAFTNNEHHIDVTKKVVNTATIVVVVMTVLQLVLYLIFPSLTPDYIKKENFDYKALWNQYVTEQNIGEEYKSFIGEEIDQYEKTKSRVYNRMQVRVENGLIQEGTLIVYYEKNTDTKEWSVVDYMFKEEGTYELAKDTTWTGSNGGNNYTITLNKGLLYDTTGHITVKDNSGAVLLDCDVICTRNDNTENEYNLKTNVDLGWGNSRVRVIFNEEDGSFKFDSVYEGTVHQQN